MSADAVTAGATGGQLAPGEAWHPARGTKIPESLVHELRYVEIHTRRKIDSLRVGAYVSPFRGVGFDFWEHRRYQIGEDVRRIDWNASARLGQLLVKVDHADRELNAMLVVDLSRSMEFGSGALAKRELLLRVAGTLAFSAAADHVHVGLLAYTDAVEAYFPPRSGRLQAWRILEYLWSARPSSARTDLAVAARTLAERQRKTTLVFLISDFDRAAPEQLPEVRTLAHRHDLVPIVIQDPLEAELPRAGGYVRVRDLETGAERVVDLSAANRRAFAAAAARRQREMIGSFYRLGIDHAHVRTGEPYLDPLVHLFLARKRR